MSCVSSLGSMMLLTGFWPLKSIKGCTYFAFKFWRPPLHIWKFLVLISQTALPVIAHLGEIEYFNPRNHLPLVLFRLEGVSNLL